jgi:solute carrier family 9 (sodium/hydrogen exchanger), member 8
MMFFASAGIGVLFALVSALLLKHADLRKNPSLEFGMMLVFTYAPYALAEGLHLSGKNLNCLKRSVNCCASRMLCKKK